ncbi:NTP transferase domain-containing protein [Lutibacter flavus]|uniref:CTP:molybdopterin cytidylyltransferase MocA n=1 Tax=Lutibacter flavus TaxID=691689 RepID=A0A238XS45_9FLAO|nr:NTP transferase domain-containing protein [Lutibacter flavus]SNR61144.1 CTP:molybdopterin cytidylyltransferase MocA [Lutibacter flavus]
MENKPVFVLLAGGKSERMGVAKGLLKYQRTFWILEQLNRISKSNIQEVYIGLGYNFQHYFDAIPGLEKAQVKFVDFQGLLVKTIINKTPELGSFSTLQTVLKNIESSKEILFNHIDIPILNTSELNKIIATKNEIVVPIFEGKKGHPIKMNPSFWNGLINIKVTNKDARLDYQLKKINPIKISIIEVFDRVILYNLNTKKDWISFLAASEI